MLLPNPIYHLCVYAIPKSHSKLIDHLSALRKSPPYHLHFPKSTVKHCGKLAHGVILILSNLHVARKMDPYQPSSTNNHLLALILCFPQTLLDMVLCKLSNDHNGDLESIQRQEPLSICQHLQSHVSQVNITHLKQDCHLRKKGKTNKIYF